ncbi:proline-rich protein 35 [Astyanax mexicanus]|uniref:proline-rich protein 35 n=1 Tax=Astyanax mexicanus TaxID=7994 RepID=UPI0020CAD3B9|nr:proline-rich protein 35 [Astyanax mexicanus]
MPKEECKVASGCKQHKERKPKKPHYIPRPFGKPYNYKCFQCPFTCMEKSHLYNHMKYSLCKNSLSLLIESDWPYKKGNLLHTDHLRLQQGELNSRNSPAKETPEGGAAADNSPAQAENFEAEGMETEEREAEGTSRQLEASSEANINGTANASPKQEAELVMADVFSLEEQLLRARSVEVESKLRHYRLSKTCLSGPAALLSEQFRLLSSQTPSAKPKSDTLTTGSLPCYPPPLTPGHLDCPEAPGLNLSLLGVGYPLTPINPGLFSYLNPALSAASAAAAAAAVTSTNSPAQIGPLPFLASAAQLTHSHTHSDRTLLTPPRLYYPFLCEHTFGDQAKSVKSSVSLDPAGQAYSPKLSMWKVPALRPANTQSSGTAWTSPSRSAADRLPARDDKEQGLKRAAAAMDSHNAPGEKKAAVSFSFDRATPTATITAERLLLHSGLHSQSGLDERFSVSPSSLGSSPHHGLERTRDSGEEKERGKDRGMESCAAALLRDLSSALQEYQHAERQAAMQPEQCHLWAHLGKIRSELSHIQQALERTSRQSDGPLDLSVKKDAVAMAIAAEGARHQILLGDRREAKEETWCSETDEEEEERDEGETEDDGNEMKERRKRSLDVLIKLNQSGVPMVKPGVTLVKSGVSMVKSEVLPGGVGGGLALRAAEAEALWHSRTTKCEADSSVLLCSKTPNRPPVCPPSPLTANDA